MADEIPMIPKASSLLINSGNIVNWNRLRKKPNQAPTKELSECVSSTFQAFLESSDKNELQYVQDLNCVHQKFKEAIPKDERGQLKLTGYMMIESQLRKIMSPEPLVKLFLCTMLPPQSVQEAIEKALSELEVSFIEVVLLALPEPENEEPCLEMIQPYWQVLEDLVHKEMVLSLGMADLDKCLLEQLYDWAEIKPVINQVNLDSCCVMPKDLVEYAKLNDIQLLTHNDPRTLLPLESLQSAIQGDSTEKDGEGWEPLWVLRYSTLVKCRGIVRSKGYFLKAQRDTKKRK